MEYPVEDQLKKLSTENTYLRTILYNLQTNDTPDSILNNEYILVRQSYIIELLEMNKQMKRDVWSHQFAYTLVCVLCVMVLFYTGIFPFTNEHSLHNVSYVEYHL
jgi:hypothetical protein